MRDNKEILATRIAAFNKHNGPRVGDYITLGSLRTDPRQGEWTRFTHDWGEHIQTGGMEGSYYLGNGYLDYSGGLDSGVAHADLVATNQTKPGLLWFFDRDISGAGRGVQFSADMRVFKLREGAKLDGIGELRCHYHLAQLNAEGHARTCNYWYCISHHGMSETAFTEEAQLHEWLAIKKLKLTHPLVPRGEYAGQMLEQVDDYGKGYHKGYTDHEK